jgi:hypothetical protein
MVEFLMTHMTKRLPHEIYMQCIGTVTHTQGYLKIEC